jgi:hypothetical protein
MKCDEVKKLISGLLDGDLDEETAGSVKEHIEKCPECQMEYLGLKRVIDALDELEELDAPPDIIVNVNKMLDEEPLYRKIFGLIAGLNIKRIPLKAMAITIVAILVVYLSQKNPATLEKFKEKSLEKHYEEVMEEAPEPEEDDKAFSPHIEGTGREVKTPEPKPEKRPEPKAAKKARVKSVPKKAKQKAVAKSAETKIKDELSVVSELPADKVIEPEPEKEILKEEEMAAGKGMFYQPTTIDPSSVKKREEEKVKGRAGAVAGEDKAGDKLKALPLAANEKDIDDEEETIHFFEAETVTEPEDGAIKRAAPAEEPASKRDEAASLDLYGDTDTNIPAEEPKSQLTFFDSVGDAGVGSELAEEEAFEEDADLPSFSNQRQLSTTPQDIGQEEINREPAPAAKPAPPPPPQVKALKPKPVPPPVAMEAPPPPPVRKRPRASVTGEKTIPAYDSGGYREDKKARPPSPALEYEYNDVMEGAEVREALSEPEDREAFADDEPKAEAIGGTRGGAISRPDLRMAEKEADTQKADEKKKLYNRISIKTSDLKSGKEILMNISKKHDVHFLVEKVAGNKVNIMFLVPLKNYDQFLKEINDEEGLKISFKGTVLYKLSAEVVKKIENITKNDQNKFLTVEIELTM